MDKRRLHHFWTKVRWVKPWYFLALAILSGVVCVLALRGNNEHMIVLRDAVFKADQNNTDVGKPLQTLQAYVTTHMNTNLSAGRNPVYPPIQLQHTYERLVQAQNQQLLEQSNSALYNEAQNYCEGLNHTDFSGRNRVPCIEQYVQSHGGQASQSAPSIPKELYQYSFVSPRWSPDLAGWSMLLAIVSLVLAVITFIARRWVRRNSR